MSNQTGKSITKIFTQTFSICRINKKKDNIWLDNPVEISRKHAEILYIKDIGYFLRDLGSTLHTYIKIDGDGEAVMKIRMMKRMQILMGKSLFIIKKILEQKIKIEVLINYSLNSNNPSTMTIELDIKPGQKLYFGRNPVKRDNAISFIYDEDSDIEEEMALIENSNNKMIFTPLKSKKG